MIKRQIILLTFTLIAILTICGTVSAANNTTNPDPPLTIVKGSWDTVGLDSNNVNAGPHESLIQFRITNPDTVNTAHNVVATFSWTSANSYVYLSPSQATTINLGNIAPGATKDVFYKVELARNAAIYSTTRSYQVTIAGSDTPTYTPTGTLLVERLNSQAANSVTGISVSDNSPHVGDTITVTFTSKTSSSTYSDINLPLVEYNAAMLLPLGMVTTWTDTNNISRSSNNIYLQSPNGNSFTTTYTFYVQAAGTSDLYPVIYDKRGGSYHYNGDYGQDLINTYVPANVGDRVWLDLNANGIYDSGEPGVANVLVGLYNTSGIQLDTRVTNSSGYFYFNDIYPQSYYLKYTIPAGYNISPFYGTGYDNKANPTNGQTAVFTLVPGQTDYNQDAGIYQPAILGNFVWDDQNADGIYSGNGHGIPNVTVTLYRSNGTVAATTTTDSNGIYQFNNVLPGSYYIGFTTPTGYYISPNYGTGYDNKANPANGLTNTFSVISGQTDLTWDAAMYQKCSVGDVVWEDSNANGIKDSGEPGLPNVVVDLLNSLGNVINTTTTNSSGNYLFNNLIPGTYYVRVNKTTGWNFSPPFQGTNDEIDSDVYPDTGKTPPITLTSGQNQLKWDAGLYQNVTIGDYVWEDYNANGNIESGEPGLPGVVVYLYDTNNTLLKTAVTNSSGYYLFDNLTPGSYYLKFNKPSGYNISLNYGSGYINQAAPSTGLTPTTTLSSGQSQLYWDAGMWKPASIGTFVWNDQNADGIYQGRGAGIPNVKVELFNSSMTKIAETYTDTNGYYSFNNLVMGTYSVKFTLQPGFTFSPVVPGQAPTNKANSSGYTDPFALSYAENNPYIDAGMYLPVTLGGISWNDLNHNGLIDAGEPGLNNITVQLYNGLTNVLVTSTLTNSSGNYLFQNLVPNFYYVKVLKPDGYIFSPQYVGSDPSKNSSVFPANGETANTEYFSGVVNTNLNAGMYQQQIVLSKDGYFSCYCDQIIWRIYAENSGSTAMNNVVIHDLITPASGMTFWRYYVSFDGGINWVQNGSYNKTTGNWTINTLPANTTYILAIYATPLTLGEDYTNTATYNDQEATYTVYIPNNDINVTKNGTWNCSTGRIEWVLSATNNGLDPANFSVWDLIGMDAPDQTLYNWLVSLDNGATWIQSGYDQLSGEWIIEGLDQGETFLLALNTTPTNGTHQTYYNYAWNDCAGLIEASVYVPDIQLNLTKNGEWSCYYDQIIWRITATNTGNDTLNTSVWDLIPDNAPNQNFYRYYISYDNGLHWVQDGKYNTTTGEWTINGLDKGETYILALYTTITQGTGKTYENTAYGSCNEEAHATVYIPDTELNLTKNGEWSCYCDQIIWRITATNTGNDTLNTSVWDLIPDNAPNQNFYRYYISYDNGLHWVQDGKYNTTTGEWTINGLDKGETYILALYTTITQGTGKTYENTAYGSCNEEAHATVYIPDTELNLTKNGEWSCYCDQIIWRITATNTGNDTLNTSVWDLIPDNAPNQNFYRYYISYDNGLHWVQDGTYNPTTGEWTINGLDKGETYILALYTTITQGTGKTYENTAYGSCNEEAHATVYIPDNQITLTKSGEYVSSLDKILWTLNITNSGNDAANVSVWDLMGIDSPNTEFYDFEVNYGAGWIQDSSYDPETGEWIVSGLDKGETFKLHIYAKPLNGAGTYYNIASDNCNDSASATATVPAALALSMRGYFGQPCGCTIYTIAVENRTASTANNITVQDIYPAGTTFRDYWVSYDNGLTFTYMDKDSSYNPTTNTWTISSLQTGVSHTAILALRLTPSAYDRNYTNTATSTFTAPTSTNYTVYAPNWP